MKQLKNESQKFITEIISATKKYAEKERSGAETLELYNIIGKAICEQGEKAFITHLVQILAENFPNLKGFSPRNLRRMRDFHNTYKGREDLLELAMNLSWTVNSVILENCENIAAFEFYLKLAISENLSKLKLIAAIEEKLHEKIYAEPIIDFVELCSDLKTAKTTCTPRQVKSKIGAFVRQCKDFLQGSSLPKFLVAKKLYLLLERWLDTLSLGIAFRCSVERFSLRIL